MGELTSSGVPPVSGEDHRRGDGIQLVAYADLACPQCAALWLKLGELEAEIVFRHFPLGSRRPRSPALHAAAEAAGLQGAFFEMVDSLYDDRGHVDDPHLWARAEELGLDLSRFEADRRSHTVAARVRRDFESGIRAGVMATPAFFLEGRMIDIDAEGPPRRDGASASV